MRRLDGPVEGLVDVDRVAEMMAAETLIEVAGVERVGSILQQI